MDKSGSQSVVPEQIQQALSLTVTVSAGILYAAILGGAVLKTVTQGAPVFNENMVRAAGLLSGLVGSVVTAGFARGGQISSVPVGYYEEGSERSTRAATRRRRTTSKFASLAQTLGALPPRTPIRRDLPGEPDVEDESTSLITRIALWVALFYFAIYFVIGIAAIAITFLRPMVPELVSNSAWVCLGTMLTTGYSFFALDVNN